MKKEIWEKNKRYIRGMVLDKSIEIEQKVSRIINDFFCKRSVSSLFKNELLDQEFFTFNTKIKILSKIIKNLCLLTKEETKEFNKLFKQCIENRNKLAHKEIFLPIGSEQEVTFMVEDNDKVSTKEEILTRGDTFVFHKEAFNIREQEENIEYGEIFSNFEDALKMVNEINDRFRLSVNKRGSVRGE